MRKRIPVILAALFLTAGLSTAQQTTPPKTAVKPKSTSIQKPGQVQSRVYTIRDLEKIRLKDLKRTDIIDLGARRYTVQEIRDMLLRRELKVGDPNNSQEVADALLKRYYEDSVRSGVTP